MYNGNNEDIVKVKKFLNKTFINILVGLKPNNFFQNDSLIHHAVKSMIRIDTYENIGDLK